MRIVLFWLLFISISFSQVREFEVKSTTNRGAIPVFTEYPDKSGVFFYAKFDNVSFKSNYPIHKIYNRSIGNYILVIDPTKQSIEISIPGYKVEVLKISDLQPRDVLYFTIEPKELPQIKELMTTIQIEPSDSELKVDGKSYVGSQQMLLSLGEHSITVEKLGFAKYEGVFNVSASNTFLKIGLENDDPIKVKINSVPKQAQLTIDNVIRGTTPKEIYLFPGTYNLKLDYNGYVRLEDKLVVKRYESNTFNYNLNKNIGQLTVNVYPPEASIYLDTKLIENGALLDINPGLYKLKISADKYLPVEKELKIEIGKPIVENINLQSALGEVFIIVEPASANISIDGVTFLNKALSNLSPGEHKLEVSLSGWSSYSKTFSLQRGVVFKDTVRLTKLAGTVVLKSNYPISKVYSDYNLLSGTNTVELMPGTHRLEILSEKCSPIIKNITIEKGATLYIDLDFKKKAGALIVNVNPNDAKCELKEGEIVVESWIGSKNLSNLFEGNYTLTACADGFKPITKTCKIADNKTSYENIVLEQGEDLLGSMSYVRGGKFVMGTIYAGESSDCSFLHTVNVNSFLIDKTEVTVGEYKKFCSATGTPMPKEPKWGWSDNLPITNMSYTDAQKYATWIGKRLPTEAEWEFAATGGLLTNGYQFAGSDNEDEVSWYHANSDGKPHPVGEKKPNELGLYDMSGNATELCSDFYNAKYYLNSPQDNPKGPVTGHNKVGRGHNFKDKGWSQVKHRNNSYVSATSGDEETGFRCVKDVSFSESERYNLRYPQARLSAPAPTKENMVFVDGGEFTMGGQYNSDNPLHKVQLNSFYIGKYEVTIGEFRKFCNSTCIEVPAQDSGSQDSWPIANITYEEASDYAKWVGKRLPTDAEWEYAARGGKKSLGFTYAGSNSVKEVAWYEANSEKHPHPVGEKKPNELGIYDMSGNISEFCSDWYDKDYPTYSSYSNPTGPSSDKGFGHAMRGGCYGYSFISSVSDRGNEGEYTRHSFHGFRVAQDAK